MRKRLLAIIATAALVVAMVPAMAFAGTAVEVDNATDFKTELENGKSVKLVKSFELATTVTVNGDVVIDLNGCTITGKDTATNKNFSLIHVPDGDSLIIEDETGNGQITLTAETDRNNMSTIIENHGGEVTINGGKLSHKGGSWMAFVVNVNANYTQNDPVLNVYGGELTSTYTAIRCFMMPKDNGIDSTCYVNIYDGIVEGDTSALWVQAPSTHAGQTAEININGGTLNGPSGGNAINAARSDKSVVKTAISSGTINGNITAEIGELEIGGGTINGSLKIFESDNQTAVTDGNFITGGTFSDNVSAYLAEGLEQDSTGKVIDPKAPTTGGQDTSKPQDSPATGDNSMAPIAVAGLALAAMAAVVATRRRTN